MGDSKRFGIICLLFGAAFWSTTSIFVKHFSLQGMDADVQNLFRYSAATVAVWVLVATAYGREALAAWRRWHTFLLPIFLNCAFQVAMVAALYKKSIYPGFMMLIGQSTVIFSTGLAFILFRDERRTIRSRRYLAGIVLAIAGVVGVVLFGERTGVDFNMGTAIAILASFLWACYTVSMKRIVRNTRPIICFAIVSTFTTIFFIVLATLRSRPSQFLEFPLLTQGLVILSGVMCISGAHSFYFRAIERLGVAVCASFLLVLPLLTGTLSWAVFGESLNAGQLLMGALLLGGACLVIRAGRTGTPAPPLRDGSA